MPKGIKRDIKRWSQRRPPNIIDEVVDDDQNLIDFSKLTERYKARRRQFVREYIKDYNGTRAFLRMGYNYERKIAQAKASTMLGEPYTQYLLSEFIEKADEKAICTKAMVMAGLWKEANADDVAFATNSATRISALKHLSKLLGMEVTNATVEVKTSGGVMMVPLAVSSEEWAKAASSSQAKLKKDVRQ